MKIVMALINYIKIETLSAYKKILKMYFNIVSLLLELLMSKLYLIFNHFDLETKMYQ